MVISLGDVRTLKDNTFPNLHAVHSLGDKFNTEYLNVQSAKKGIASLQEVDEVLSKCVLWDMNQPCQEPKPQSHGELAHSTPGEAQRDREADLWSKSEGLQVCSNI